MRRIATALLLLLSGIAHAGGGPSDTVVLVNDDSPDGQRVAAHYLVARDIPPTHLCRVRSSTDATVPVADFVRDVVDPLRRFLAERQLEDRVRFLVLTQGLPIRLRAPGGMVSSAAALELLDTPICGSDGARMPRYQNAYLSGAAPRTTLDESGRLILVTALISSTADEAIALIDRSVAADGTAPKKTLFVFQDARGNAANRNPGYDPARAELEKLGHKSEHVPAGADEVRERKRVMGYMSGGSYSRLSVAGVDDNEYLPGALCDMLQSFGAVPANFVPGGKGKQFPITHMIRAGITGVHGAVAEPYNITFPSADLFTPYVHGFTLAETFHQKLPFRYWMNLVLGDPLCAPYAKRPKVVVYGAPRTGWSGEVSFVARAKGAESMAVFVDGVPVTEGAGDELNVVIDTARFQGGKRHVLIEATGAGEAEPRGWTVLQPTFVNENVGVDQPASAPLPAGLRLEVPDQVQAGESFEVRLVALSEDGTPFAPGAPTAWLSSAKPPVRWARGIPVDGTPHTLRLVKSGDVTFRAQIPGAHAVADAVVRVASAEMLNVTTPVSRVALGQVSDLPLQAVDRFGNIAEDYSGPVRVEAPGNPGADVGRTAEMVRGRGVIRDVLITHSGPRRLVFRDGGGATVSGAQEGIRVARGAVRAWVVSQPSRGDDAAALFKSGAKLLPQRHGDVVDGTLFVRHRDGDDQIDLSTGLRDGDSVVAVAFVHALADTDVKVNLAAKGRVVVALDGKIVHDGVVDGSDPANTKKRSTVAKLKISKGRHRLSVITERRGRAAFALELQGGGEEGRLVRIVADMDEEPSTMCLSGRVLRPAGARGAAGVSVELAVGDAKHTTKSDAAGLYWFADVPAGAAVVTAGSAPVRTVTVDDANVTGVDIRLPDTKEPTVTLPAGSDGRHVGSLLVLTADVKDDGKVRQVRLLLGGDEAAPPLTAPPWRFEVDVAGRDRGPLALEVRASDASGKEGTSGEIKVRLVNDKSGPKVTLSGLSANALLRKTARLVAKVSDPIGVRSVSFSVDGAPGDTLTAAPYEIALNPAAFEKGKHLVEIVARDTDGHETKKKLPFRVR